MEVRVENINQKILAGLNAPMSFSENKTHELWRKFMPLVKQIKNRVGEQLYSVEVYSSDYFERFHPEAMFEKWAAVEVSDLTTVSEEMNVLTVPACKYAIFTYRGHPNKAAKAYQYIFRQWLPQSTFVLDQRPHLAIMGAGYRQNSPDSEEEICIPVREK